MNALVKNEALAGLDIVSHLAKFLVSSLKYQCAAAEIGRWKGADKPETKEISSNNLSERHHLVNKAKRWAWSKELNQIPNTKGLFHEQFGDVGICSNFLKNYL